MKRISIAFSIFFLIILSLSSCFGLGITKRTNFMVSGSFFGVNEYNEEERYGLEVTEISKNEFIQSNGKNALHDLVNGGYYHLSFFRIDDQQTYLFFDFINFKDAYNGAKGTPISYVDENGSWLTPYADIEDPLPYYAIHITNNITGNNSEAFVYCHLKGDIS